LQVPLADETRGRFVADAEEHGSSPSVSAPTPVNAVEPEASVDLASALEPGDPERVGSYELLGRLGHGGMGTVYLARSGDGKRVAVKVIRPELAADGAFVARFHREVAAARQVAGFCTARVLDAGLDTPSPFLVTEYVEGVRLDRAIARNGPLSGSNLDGFAVGVAAALTAIHTANVVHRDLKPSNVLLSYFGPRVIDFGIARALDAGTEVTRASMVMGTPGWMAPEQLTGGPASQASDIFVWGTLVAFAATGRQPFGLGSATEVAYRIVHEQPDLDGLDGPLRGTVERAMQRDSKARPTAKALLMELLGEQQVEEVEPERNPRAAVTQVLQRTWVTPGAEQAPQEPHPSAVPTRPLGEPSILDNPSIIDEPAGEPPAPTPPQPQTPAAAADAGGPPPPPQAPAPAGGHGWAAPQPWPADPWAAQRAPQQPRPQPWQQAQGEAQGGWQAGWPPPAPPYPYAPPQPQWPQQAAPWQGPPPGGPPGGPPGTPAGQPHQAASGTRARVWTARLVALVAVVGAIGSGADYSSTGASRLLAIRLLAMFTLLTIAFIMLPASRRARTRAVTSRVLGSTIIVLTGAVVLGLTERRSLHELIGSLTFGLVTLFLAFWLYPKQD
jgi:serine/threonine protein kinase